MEHKYAVESSCSGWRLDKFLVQYQDQLSRSKIQSLIENGMVLVNGSITKKKGYLLWEGDEVSITVLEEAEFQSGENIDLDIRYQDQWLLIVNKPVGMVVHPAPGHSSGTLVNALLGTGLDLSETDGQRPGIVHRLDKDTSGLLLVAKTNQCHWQLSEMLKARQIKRTYLALVAGIVPQEQGRVEGPIGRHPSNRTKMAVVEHGKAAVTHFKVMKRFGRHTLLSVKLETGRTHQIRVHFSLMGYPVIGDKVYGRSDPELNGHLLHARTLEFEHPFTAKNISVSVGPPQEFVQRLQALFLYGAGGQQRLSDN